MKINQKRLMSLDPPSLNALGMVLRACDLVVYPPEGYEVRHPDGTPVTLEEQYRFERTFDLLETASDVRAGRVKL